MRILHLLLVCIFSASSAIADKPNVILIITDDQGYGDLSAHGNPVLKTPNMDRWFAESVRFTDFHVAPMCSPTRGQLMTGRDAMKNGCTAVCQGRSMMHADLPTMANFFEESGYATGHFGKWHLGDSYPHRPQDRGFQETIHHRAWGITSLADYWGNTYFDPVLSHNGTDNKFEGYCTDIFFSESMEWIEKVQAEEKPFFLYLPTNTPHVPNVCAEEYSKPYVGQHEGKPIPDTFYGMIANLDENVGKLDAFLRANGLRDNTILIFMSDNGTQSKQAQAIYNAGMRDRKTSVFEGGHRVPCFVRWPAGGLKHGSEVHELAEVQDLLPTLIELCGLGQGNVTFDGISLAGLLKGTETELPDRKLVVQYRVSGEPWDPAVVMWDKWRLINRDRLYHVGRDPGQTKNVADQHPDVVQEMAAHYDTWHRKAKPLFDLPRWITIGTEQANPLTLYAQDWTGGYCDNRGGLTRATAQGYWNVIVDREGIYILELRRWPRESGKSLTEGAEGPADTGFSARPIAAANLQIAGENYTLDTKPKDTHVTFRARLPAGKTQLATALMDAEDRALCSAIYVYLERVADDEAEDPALTSPATRRPKESAPPKKRNAAKAKPPQAALAVDSDEILINDFQSDPKGKESVFDKYGGALAMKGIARGAFHLEKVNGRHCLVTPDGHGFLTLGVNHISAIARPTGFDLFAESYNHDWKKFCEAAFTNLHSWGYNTAGYGCPQPLRRMMPYFADSFLEKNSNYLPDSDFNYPDVFDPEVQRTAIDKLRVMCEREKDNPNLVGFYWTDTPQWDLQRSRKTRGTDWVSAIRSLPATAPGKKRYLQFLSQRCGGDLNKLADAYHVTATHFDDLIDDTFQTIDLTNNQVKADDLAFLRIIAREHYRVIGDETRGLHPGALIFGERYLMGDHPDVVIEEALPYIDALAIQPYGSTFDGEFFDQLYEKTGKPILLCDHQSSFATPEHPKTMWKQLDSEEAVAEAYRRHLHDAFEKPYILGYQRCQYIDRFAKHPGVLKQGLLREDGSPYETLVQRVSEANAKAIQDFANIASSPQPRQ